MKKLQTNEVNKMNCKYCKYWKIEKNSLYRYCLFDGNCKYEEVLLK